MSKSRESMATGILRLRHLMETTEAVGDDMQREAIQFDALRESGPARAVSAFNLFQTPEAVANRMVRLAGIKSSDRVLEPSAGLGRIYRAIRCLTDCHVTMVDVAPQCTEELFRETRGDDAATLVQDDFLACDSARLGGLFDKVVMNPPFKNGLDVKHIRHAVTLLKHGGTLVTLCYAGTKQRAEFENSPEWSWEMLPSGSFKAEGTTADVAIVTYKAKN